jgi:hypothetical protein
VEQVIENVCPNYGGGFTPRPVRPVHNLHGDNYLGKYPASVIVKHRPVDLEAHARLLASVANTAPERR